MVHPLRRGVARVEIVAVLLVMPLLAAAGLPLLQDARSKAELVQSTQNLRSLGIATAVYASEWSDRQFTMTRDNLATFGKSVGEAVAGMDDAPGTKHPALQLGWHDGELRELDLAEPENRWLLLPISFDATPRGWFRALNCRQFNQYLNGRFYDPGFYAPKDAAVLRAVSGAFEVESEYTPLDDPEPSWSSYSWSAAALYSPAVVGMSDEVGRPFAAPRSFRSPAFSASLYPNLKTNIMEHHWLQNRPEWLTDCQPGVEGRRYGGCEPYTFNHYAFSKPAALFFDGHVETVLNNDVLAGDTRVIKQGGGEGLWLRSPGAADNGFFEDRAVDRTRTSWHVFTRDGIRGRDVVGR